MALRFREEFVQEVRAAASIVAVVGAYLPLKKAGRSHKGLCPFHSEKTPSFNVDEGRGIYHCFGCGEGGDVFKFVMQIERIGFPEAIQKVAELSGIPLPEGRDAASDRRERLYAANERALQVYREALAAPAGKGARSYLERRGLAAETVDRFELGVTPPGWEGVTTALQRKGFKPDELIAAGLSSERPSGRGLYDRFHERLIFPIRNASGRLVGFGGRSLTDQPPKYLNSPDTEIYSKSDLLYGLWLARDAARQAGYLVLVEGYLDLIAVEQAGVREVVASLGTSLTERHARLLARYVPRVYLAYDGDAAGRNATKRALRTLVPERLQVAVVELPAGEDPDDFIRAHGAAGFRERLAGARGFVAFLTDLARAAEPSLALTPEGRLKLVQEVLPILAAINDPVERAVHVGSLAEAAGIEDLTLIEALRKAVAERRQEVAAPGPAPARRLSCSEDERVLLRALLAGPETLAQLAPQLDPRDWQERPVATLFAAVLAAWEGGQAVSAAVLLSSLEDAATRDLLGRLLVQGPDVTSAEGESALESLRKGRLERELRALQTQIQQGKGGADVDALLERKQELSRLLHSLAES